MRPAQLTPAGSLVDLDPLLTWVGSLEVFGTPLRYGSLGGLGALLGLGSLAPFGALEGSRLVLKFRCFQRARLALLARPPRSSRLTLQSRHSPLARFAPPSPIPSRGRGSLVKLGALRHDGSLNRDGALYTPSGPPVWIALVWRSFSFPRLAPCERRPRTEWLTQTGRCPQPYWVAQCGRSSLYLRLARSGSAHSPP
jgi:hypothetical protein